MDRAVVMVVEGKWKRQVSRSFSSDAVQQLYFAGGNFRKSFIIREFFEGKFLSTFMLCLSMHFGGVVRSIECEIFPIISF